MFDPAIDADLAGTLHIWTADPERIPAPLLIERYLPLLDEEEGTRFRRFHFERDRLHYLAAHALLRLTLSRHAPLHPSEWRFIRGSHGKPEVVDIPGAPPLRFNLTHTQGLVACVVSSDGECGIDVERVRPMQDMRGVAETVFSDEEIAWLDSHEQADWPEKFFTLWTLKEAYIKAIGLGFSAPVRQITFDASGPAPRLATHAGMAFGENSWQFGLFKPTPSHHLAIAAHSSSGALSCICRQFDWD